MENKDKTKGYYKATPYLKRSGVRIRLVYWSRQGNARRWLEFEPAEAVEQWGQGRGNFENYILSQAFQGEGESVEQTLHNYSLTPTAIQRAWGRGKSQPRGLRIWLARKEGNWGGKREAKEWSDELRHWWEVYVDKAVESHSLGWYNGFADAYEAIMGRETPKKLEKEFHKAVLEKQKASKV